MDHYDDRPPRGAAKGRLEAARHLLDSVHSQIRAADEKVRVLFSGTALLAAALAINPGGLAAASGASSRPHGLVFTVAHSLLLVSVGVAVLSAIAALLPRVKVDRPVRSLYFFGDIASAPHDGFLAEFGEAADEDLLRQVLSQVHVNAAIARTKHRWIRRAAVAFAAAVLFLVANQALVLFLG